MNLREFDQGLVKEAPKFSSTRRLEKAGNKEGHTLQDLPVFQLLCLEHSWMLLDTLTPAAPTRDPQDGVCILPSRRPCTIKRMPRPGLLPSAQLTLPYSGSQLSLQCKRLDCRTHLVWVA